MRIGIISDIHGNIFALEKVMKFLLSQSLDRLFCLGDIVGYGPHPNECVEIIRDNNVYSILGNHDLAVLNLVQHDNYNSDAVSVIEWTSQVLKPENKQFLHTLDLEFTGSSFHISHGAPPFPLEFSYLYDLHQARNLLYMYEDLSEVTFIGHSHLTKSFYFNIDNIIEFNASTINTQNRGKFICTAGSVGQPRDHDPRSACITFDTKTKIIKYHRIKYPIEKTIREIQRKKLPAFAGYRLRYGI